MPSYEFECGSCGTFTLTRTVANRDLPAACPQCLGSASRIVTVPRLALMNPATRKAHQVNERSRHQPRVGPSHSCSSKCGCRSKKTGATPKIQTGRRGQRPWMLGH